MSSKINFRNPNRGKQPRANRFYRAWRMIRRKRVAYARHGAAHALKVAQRELDRVYQLAKAHNVPMDDTGPLPVLPTLPDQSWVEYRQAMGTTRPVVKPAPPEPAEAIRA